jgi:hypothetical protein
LAARAEEVRVQLGDRVIAAAHAKDFVEQRSNPVMHTSGPTTANTSTTSAQRDLALLVQQAQFTGTQLHQLAGWVTQLMQAGESLAQRLEHANTAMNRAPR